MSKIKLTGSNSGYVEIASAADAGNLTLTLPTGGTALLGNAGNVFSGITTTGQLDINGSIDVSSTSVFNDDLTLTGASYNVLWDKSDNQLEFGDNAKLSFGGSSDLQIYHAAGADSIIHHTATSGSTLRLRSRGFTFKNQANSATIATFNEGDACKLFFNGSQKFETTNTGAIVTGICTASMLNIYGTNVKPVIGDRTAHTVHYSSYDTQNNTTLEITSSGTGTNVAGLAINNPTTSANSSYKTLTFCCSGTSNAEKRGAIITSNHDEDSSSTIKGNLSMMVNNGSGLQTAMLINRQGHVQKAHTAMFSARGQGSWNTFNSGSGWYSLGDANIGGTQYYINHGWTTSGGGCAVRGATNAGNSIWENDKARFTAPVTGFYNFEISMYIRTSGGGYTFHVQPWLDSTNLNFYTSNIGNIRNSSNSLTGNTQEYPHVARSINIYMSANQTFQWAVYSQGTSNFLSHFDYAHQSGYLIG